MTTAASTQTDEQTTVTETPAAPDDQQTYVSSREAAMAAIDEQVTRQLQEQGVLPVEGETATEVPPAPAPADQAERMLKVKVGGQEMELPESEVIKGYQKDSYADQRLREAADRLKEVEERERQLELQRQASPPESTEPTPTSVDAATLAQQIVDGIAEGDYESAVQTLTQALATAQPGVSTPVVDEAKVAELVERANSNREYELDKQKANQIFEEQYADLVEDDDKFAIAQGYYSQEVAAGKKPSEAALAAGERMRKLFPAPAPPPDPMKERQERKQGIDTIIPATGVVQSSATTETATDPRSVIEEMKRLRGQS